MDELDDTGTTTISSDSTTGSNKSAADIAATAPAAAAAEAAASPLSSSSSSSSPLISVCLPLHNALPFLGATLVSLVHATHRPLEMCAFDDCSSDGTMEVLENFREMMEAKGVQLHARRSERGAAGGAGYARNQCLAQARGAYFAMQDADDLSLPARFSQQLHRCREIEAEERADPARRSSNPHAIVLVGCNLQRLPLGATPRWRRWINGLTDPLLTLQAFREVTLPCPGWFLSRESWVAAGAAMPEKLAEDMIFFYENILARGGRLTKVGGDEPAAGIIAEKSATTLVADRSANGAATSEPSAPASSASAAAAAAASSVSADAGLVAVPPPAADSSSSVVVASTTPSLCTAPPLLIYRNHASNLSGRTPFALLLSMRVGALVSLVLRGSRALFPRFADPALPLCIWNAGKAGKRVYRLLPPDLQARVTLMADIDPRKLALGHFDAHEPGSRKTGRRIPIVSWQAATSPCLIAVRQELEENESQREFIHRIRVVKGWKEGIDFLFLS
jgi:hypothetical protein